MQRWIVDRLVQAQTYSYSKFQRSGIS